MKALCALIGRYELVAWRAQAKDEIVSIRDSGGAITSRSQVPSRFIICIAVCSRALITIHQLHRSSPMSLPQAPSTGVPIGAGTQGARRTGESSLRAAVRVGLCEIARGDERGELNARQGKLHADRDPVYYIVMKRDEYSL